MTLFNSALNQTTKISSSVVSSGASYEIKLPPIQGATNSALTIGSTSGITSNMTWTPLVNGF